MDGVDAALLRIDASGARTLASLTMPYPPELGETLKRVVHSGSAANLDEIAMLDVETGAQFAAAVNGLLEEASVAPEAITAIGSHGQTLRHSPDTDPAYSWQIGDPATIAARCGVTTVADFRSPDLACGGEGAPLVPPFHEYLFRIPDVDRVIVNVGGIANVTMLPADADGDVIGFDVGPGNCLMDEWCEQHTGKPFDRDGEWARSGSPSTDLLEALMDDEWFARPPPKSTGREFFNRAYLEARLAAPPKVPLRPEDVQATLVAFTVEGIRRAISDVMTAPPSEICVCGGGAANAMLMSTLARRFPESRTLTTSELGVDADYVEACAFAWLAAMRLADAPIRLTTAEPRRSLILGAVYSAPRAGSGIRD